MQSGATQTQRISLMKQMFFTATVFLLASWMGCGEGVINKPDVPYLVQDTFVPVSCPPGKFLCDHKCV